MQVTNLKLESNMKEELLEAIYATVERLEQKVDELSASTKKTETGAIPIGEQPEPMDWYFFHRTLCSCQCTDL